MILFSNRVNRAQTSFIQRLKNQATIARSAALTPDGMRMFKSIQGVLYPVNETVACTPAAGAAAVSKVMAVLADPVMFSPARSTQWDSLITAEMAHVRMIVPAPAAPSLR